MPEKKYQPLRVNTSMSESDYAANMEVQTIMKVDGILNRKSKTKDAMTLAIEKLDEEFNSRKNSFQESFYKEISPVKEIKSPKISSPVKINPQIESPIRTPPKIMISTLQNDSHEDLSLNDKNDATRHALKSSSKILRPSPLISSRTNSISKSAYSLASKSEAQITISNEENKSESVATLVQKFNSIHEQAQTQERVSSTSPRKKSSTSKTPTSGEQTQIQLSTSNSINSFTRQQEALEPLKNSTNEIVKETKSQIKRETPKISSSTFLEKVASTSPNKLNSPIVKSETPKLSSGSIKDEINSSIIDKIERKASRPSSSFETTFTDVTQNLNLNKTEIDSNRETPIGGVIIRKIRRLNTPKMIETNVSSSNLEKSKATSYVSIGKPVEYIPRLINSCGFEPNLAVTNTQGESFKFGAEIQSMIDTVKPLIDEKLKRKTYEIKSLNYAYDNFGPGCSHFVKAIVDNEMYIHVRVYTNLVTLKPDVSVLTNRHPNESIELFL